MGGALSSSFRDPAGYAIRDDRTEKRVVTWRGRDDYDAYMSSGLHDALLQKGSVLAHRDGSAGPVPSGTYRMLAPQKPEYISYPYEWSFDQLKDAALLTLDIEETALRYGMSLKDASAFNVQFRGPSPVFTDCLSFEMDRDGPWLAYDQFCRHFLAPLLLMKHGVTAFNRYAMLYLSGIPLDVASRLLPWSSRFNRDALRHIHLHGRKRQMQHGGARENGGDSRRLKQALVRSLYEAVEGLSMPAKRGASTADGDAQQHYSPDAERFKARAVRNLTARQNARLVYDLGASTGRYSQEAASTGAYCIAFDSDQDCVNRMYTSARAEGRSRLLPLVMDVLSPTPAIGLDLAERASFPDRGTADLTLALALVHHLRIVGGAPLARIAAFLARVTNSLLIEFVPKSDPMVAVMLRDRPDTFDDLTHDGFLAAFGAHFTLDYRVELPGTSRLLCLYTNRRGRAA